MTPKQFNFENWEILGPFTILKAAKNEDGHKRPLNAVEIEERNETKFISKMRF